MAGINKTLYEKPNTLQPMLTAEEVMDYLHIKDLRTLKKLMDDEQLPYLKINKSYLIPLDKLNKWIDSRMVNRIK